MRRLLLALSVLLLAHVAAAQDRFFHLGARATAMGGAFTGVADDSTAFYWNPAGIAFGRFVSAGAYHGQDEMHRGGQFFEGRATGLSLQYTFMGVAFTKFSQSVDSKRLDTSDLAVSVLQSLPIDNLVLGGNVHYLRATAYVEDDASGVSSDSWDVDLGVMYEPNDRVRLGLMMRQLRQARFRTAIDDEELKLRRGARAGVSFRWPSSFLVAFDVDLTEQGLDADPWREISLGAEKAFLDGRLHARGGLRVEVGSELGARPGFSIGGGFHFWVLELEAAYLGSSGGRDEAYWLGITLAR